MEQMNWKKIASVFFATLNIVFTCLAFYFDILKIERNETTTEVNAFELMNGTDMGIKSNGWIRTCCYLIMIVFVIEILVILLTSVWNNEKIDNVLKKCLLINVVLSFMYMLNGIVAICGMIKLIDKKYVNSAVGGFEIQTLTIIPFIIVSICAFFYFILNTERKKQEN